jgi:gas vesicle structural protein
MTVTQSTGGGAAAGPQPTGLADVIDTILDKGMVIDAYVRVSLVGIELLTVDARIVIASVDTYLRFAEAVGRLNIEDDKETLSDLVGDMEEGGASSKTKGAISGALDAAGEKLGRHDDGERERAPQRRRRHGDDE